METHYGDPKADHRLCAHCIRMQTPDAALRRSHVGASCWLIRVLPCHQHKHQPLELLCQTCDILSCGTCHLAAHKDHRLVHISKALQEQQWLFENLMVQVEDKRSMVEKTAKLIESRIHSVKSMQKKVENQIKMAKMIMMNELTKRANLLVEELENISAEVKQQLEEQLKGMIERCSQLGHLHNFISWAMSQHRRSSLLFSKELMTYQMERLLVSQLHSDLEPPVKVKFNWDASYWTKQMSTLGQLTTEGGGQLIYGGVACPTVLKPQPFSYPGMLDTTGVFQPCCPQCAGVAQVTPAHPDLLMGHSREPQSPFRPYQQIQPNNKQLSSPLHIYQVPQSGVGGATEPRPRPLQSTKPPVDTCSSLPSVHVQTQTLDKHVQTAELNHGTHSNLEAEPKGAMPDSECRISQCPSLPQQGLASPRMSSPARSLPHKGPSLLSTTRAKSPNLLSVGPLEAPPTRSLATVTTERAQESLPDGRSLISQRAESALSLATPPPARRCSSPATQSAFCKTEPANAVSVCEATVAQGEGLRMSKTHTRAEDSKPPDRVRLPFVRLERLKINITPGQGSASSVCLHTHPTSSSCPDWTLQTGSDVPTNPSDEELEPAVRIRRLIVGSQTQTVTPQWSDPEPESEQESESEALSASEPDLESESESESDVATNQQPDSDPALESDSESESEQPLESDLDAPDFDSDSEPDAPLTCGDMVGAGPDASVGGATAAMENEDFCAVCLNGGDLLCCDRCPKVFHLSCHVPALLSFPKGDWICTLCRDVLNTELEYDCENIRHISERTGRVSYGLSQCDQRRCEKLTLHIYCNILSGPFHEPVSPLARHYYQIIRNPMDLSVIRSKLDKSSALHYYTPEEFVSDVFLMFRNCAKFNYPDSEVAQAGRSLETYFCSKLRDIYPDKAFLPLHTSDSEAEDGADTHAALPWHEGKDHGHRKRKRKNSVNRRKHSF